MCPRTFSLSIIPNSAFKSQLLAFRASALSFRSCYQQDSVIVCFLILYCKMMKYIFHNQLVRLSVYFYCVIWDYTLFIIPHTTHLRPHTLPVRYQIRCLIVKALQAEIVVRYPCKLKDLVATTWDTWVIPKGKLYRPER